MRVLSNYSWVTKEYLNEQYIKNHKDIQEIANLIGCGYGTSYRLIKKFKIKTRPEGSQPGKYATNYIDGRTNAEHRCIDCNKELVLIYAKRCRECWYKFQHGENSPNWNGGSSFEPYSISWNNKLKEEIRIRDNYTCQNPGCNCTQEENLKISGKKLNIHHIDYDKENCEETNLISLCNSCHMKTHYNREHWKMLFKNLIEKMYYLVGKRG